MNILNKISEFPTQRMEAILAPEKDAHSSKNSFLSWMKKIALALFLLLFFGGMYLYAARFVSHNSDDASIVLQAYDLIHTSKILNGWYLPADNFITLDMPLYALGLLLGGNMHALMQIVPALIYTGVIVSGIYLASFGKKGMQKLFAPLAFVAIVAFPSLGLLTLVLQGPMHVGTVLVTLLAFIAYYFSKERPYKVISLLVLGLLTVLLVIGDPMSEVIQVLPILLVEGILLYKSKFTSRKQYAIIGMVSLSTLLALYVRHIWGHHVDLLTLKTHIETLSNIVLFAQYAIQVVFSLFHADIFQKTISVKILPEIVNTCVVLFFAAGLWKWRKKLFVLENSHNALIAVFIFAIVANILAFICTDIARGPVVRYLLPVLVFGGIIALPVLSYNKKPELYIAISSLFLLNGSFFFHMLYSTPLFVQPENAVITLLKEKHLTKGIGQYWSGTSITGQSNYTITIRQMEVSYHQLHPYFPLSNDRWFRDDALKNDQFIVYKTNDKGFYEASVASFGKPDHIYTVGDFIILVWNTPLLQHTQPGYHLYRPIYAE